MKTNYFNTNLFSRWIGALLLAAMLLSALAGCGAANYPGSRRGAERRAGQADPGGLYHTARSIPGADPDISKAVERKDRAGCDF